jgi:nucleoside-diphosphate-sugar epimerase
MISGRDIASAAIAAAESKKAIGEIYNLGADDFGTMREAYKDLVAYAGTGVSITSLPRLPTKCSMWILDNLSLVPLTTFHYKTIDRDFYFDISKAEEDLDWNPQDNNSDCLQRGYEYFISDTEQLDQNKEGHRNKPNEKILKWIKRVS